MSEGLFRPKMASRSSGKTEPPKPSELQAAATDLLKAAKDSVVSVAAGRTAREFLSEGGGGGGAAAGMEMANQQLTTILTNVTNTLTGLVELERKARQAAEDSKVDMMQKYFATVAEQAKDLQDRVRNVQPTAPRTLQDIVSEFGAFQDLVNTNAVRIAQDVVAKTQPGASKTGMTSIDVDLKKLEMQQTIGLEQMRQTHELAMKQLDLRLKEIGLQTAQWSVQQSSRQSWFEDIMGSVGKAIVQGSVQGQAEQAGYQAAPAGEPPPAASTPTEAKPSVASGPRSGHTSAGLIAIECITPGCKPFAVVPGMPTGICPTCGVEYDLSELEE
jgi:hypothetical protein